MVLGAGLEPARPNGWEILSYLHCDTTQDSPPKHKSNVLPAHSKLTLNALSLNYDLGHFLLRYSRRGANYRCDCDNHRPDTLRVGYGAENRARFLAQIDNVQRTLRPTGGYT